VITWKIPADGSTSNFGVDLTSFSTGATAGTIGTVVPEPSSFALLAGCLGLAGVMLRRRR
jgi:hypothetical protein